MGGSGESLVKRTSSGARYSRSKNRASPFAASAVPRSGDSLTKQVSKPVLSGPSGLPLPEERV